MKIGIVQIIKRRFMETMFCQASIEKKEGI